MKLLTEFKQFALKGNAIDMAVAVIVGAAFNNVVNSIVQDLVMPPLGWIIGGVDFKDLKLIISPPEHGNAEVAILYGKFITILLQFLIVAWTVFIVVKVMNKLIADRISPPPATPPPGK